MDKFEVTQADKSAATQIINAHLTGMGSPNEIAARHRQVTTAQLEARVAELEDLLKVLLDNDPDDMISDAGHIVLDLWRNDARQALAKKDAV